MTNYDRLQFRRHTSDEQALHLYDSIGKHKQPELETF